MLGHPGGEKHSRYLIELALGKVLSVEKALEDK